MADNARSSFSPPPGAIPLHNVGGETFKWDKPGKTLQGVFGGFESGSMGGKLIRVQTGAGVEVASAPLQLERALSGIAVGTRIVIRYTGEVKAKSDRMVKAFEVWAVPGR